MAYSPEKDPEYITFILRRVFASCERFRELQIRHIVNITPDFTDLLTSQEKELLELDKTNTEKLEILKDIATRRWTFEHFQAFVNVLKHNYYDHVGKALEEKLNEIRSLNPRLPQHRNPPIVASRGHVFTGIQARTGPAFALSDACVETQQSLNNYQSTTIAASNNLSASSRYQRAFPSSNSHFDSQQQTALKVPVSASAQKDDCQYAMETTPRGMAIVINNERFDHFEDRNGSSKDKEHLANLFNYLDFKVAFFNNLKAAKMKDTLHLFAQDKRLELVSAILVVILTHGMGQDVLFGSDGKTSGNEPVADTYITRIELQKLFNSKYCPRMQNKPKGFIIQTCRGAYEDIDMVKKRVDKQRLTSDGATLNYHDGCERGDGARVPETVDFLFVFPSTSGYKAYRQPQTGSPFIKKLTRLIKTHASTSHFEEILFKLRQEFSIPMENDAFMTPESISTLMKHWYFHPPSQ